MRSGWIVAGVAFGVVAASASWAQMKALPSRDWNGAADHPIISRFTGAVITAYERKDYDEAVFPTGGYVKYDEQLAKSFANARTLEGKVTRIAYAAPQGKSTLEIFRNYEQALDRAGFKTLFTCAGGKSCGNSFVRSMLKTVHHKGVGHDNTLNQTLSAAGDDARHVTAHLPRASGDVFASVTVAKGQNNLFPGILVQIVESEPMQTGQVTVDAKSMAAAVRSEGRVALYGILFDTDSANIKPESAAALGEMAKFLAAEPQLKAYIVGHTDNAGSLSHNLTLSQRRAEAVVQALVRDHGVSAQRLAAKGLASYAPAASNRNEEGRSRNRRVELVEQ